MSHKNEGDYLATFLNSDKEVTMVKVALIRCTHSNKEDDYGKNYFFTPPLCMRCKRAAFTITTLINTSETYKKAIIYHSCPYTTIYHNCPYKPFTTRKNMK